MKRFLGVMICLLAFACTNSPKVQPPLTELMLAQQNAWNNGDIDGFMKHYWASDSLLFIGSKGIANGWQQTLTNYKNSYPTKDKMGQLMFKQLSHQEISNNAYRTVGNWNLNRKTDTLNGYFLLIWEIKNGRWVITADHSS